MPAKWGTTMTSTNVNIQTLLNEILSGGRDLAQNAKAKVASTGAIDKGKALGKKGEDLLIEKLGLEDTPKIREALRKGVGTGAAAGALLLMLKSKSGRKLATLGGLAGLGTLAYKAYQKNGGKMPKNWKDEVVGLLKGPKAENRSEAIMRAMIAAAKADGEISDDEMAFIKNHDEVDLGNILDQAADPIEIARLSDSDQASREIYAASCRIANGLNEKERDYLDNLAMALRLDPDLAARLETDVRTG